MQNAKKVRIEAAKSIPKPDAFGVLPPWAMRALDGVHLPEERCLGHVELVTGDAVHLRPLVCRHQAGGEPFLAQGRPAARTQFTRDAGSRS